MQQFFHAIPEHGIPSAALFLSGSGTNASSILKFLATSPQPAFQISVIVSDNSASNARKLAEQYQLPYVSEDIRAFYRVNGSQSTSLATSRGRELREQWTATLRERLRPFRIDFGILAGFTSLTNLTGDFPCLNVHPGDLLVTDERGKRLYVGLQTVPVEKAILAGETFLRSSVILALPYISPGDDMDNGPLVGISEPVAVNLYGFTLEELRADKAARQGKKPSTGWGDNLEKVVAGNLENLKIHGDWEVFPSAAAAFAENRYSLDNDNQLYFKEEDGSCHRIKTIVFSNGKHKILPWE